MAKWFTDAQLAGEAYKEIAFRNRRIDHFLDTHDRFLIVASKGMGKTLLLRLKRDRVYRENKSFILIPKDSQSDYVDLGGRSRRNCLVPCVVSDSGKSFGKSRSGYQLY